MQIFAVLAVAGATVAAVPEPWEQRPLPAQQAGDDHAQDASTSYEGPFSTTELEEYIEDVMERWHTPGMAVAIIKGESTWTKVSLTTGKGDTMRFMSLASN